MSSLWRKIRATLLYEFAERISWYIRMACIAGLCVAALALIVAMWRAFWVGIDMVVRDLNIPR